MAEEIIKEYYMNLFDSNGICQLCKNSKTGIPYHSIYTASKAIQPTHAAWHKARGDKVDVELGRVYREIPLIRVIKEGD